MEDNVLVVVFPSDFSQNKIKSLITNIKKILKIENQKFHKIRQEGDIIVVETDDPVFTSSTINTLFGIKGVAIAKRVTNNFNSIVNGVSKVGTDLFLENQTFLIHVEGYAKGFVQKDVEVAATSSIIEKNVKKGTKPGSDEKHDKKLYVYLTKPYAYICIYYDKGLGGIPNNSQNKKAICCIFDELSAVSCAETIKQGFDTKLIICFTKESELLDLAKMVNQLIHKTVKSKLDLEFYKVPIKKTLTSLLLLEITTELLSRVANSNNIKRISLSLSPLIYPIDFLENTLTQIYKKKLIPYLPLSGLDDNIISSAKDIGLERYVSNIHKHSKSKFYNSNKSEKEIKKITDVTISTRKTIFINVGPNSLHEILDKIIPEH
jgi:adenylyl- and sulfurtransferase ThiI